MTPCRFRAAATLDDRLLERGTKANDRPRQLRANCFAQDVERVADAFEPTRVQNGLVGKRGKPNAQRQKTAHEISAVDRRNVARVQRYQRASVVPVEKVASMPLE